MKDALAISWNIIDKKTSLSILILSEFGALPESFQIAYKKL
jgi:hypothetical protein